MRAQPRESPRQRQTLPRGLPSPRPVPRDGSSSALLDPGPTRLQAGAPSSPSSPRILREHLGEVGSPLGGLLPASPMRAPPASQGRPWPGSHPQTHLGESGQRWPRPAGEGQGEEAVRGRVRGAAGLRASSREDIGKQQQPGHPPAGGGGEEETASLLPSDLFGQSPAGRTLLLFPSPHIRTFSKHRPQHRPGPRHRGRSWGCRREPGRWGSAVTEPSLQRPETKDSPGTRERSTPAGGQRSEGQRWGGQHPAGPGA